MQRLTSAEVELPQQFMSLGKPLVLTIFGSGLAIVTAFCCVIVISYFLHTSQG